jgi:hypothetical protein
MKIHADAVLPFDRPRVFAAYRDRLLDLVPHLPNIRSITIESRSDRGDEIDFVNLWVGGGDIPKAVRGVLSESMLRWTDYATWNASDYSVTWRTDIHAFPGAAASSGKNHYIEVPGGTRVELRGELTIDGSKVPAIPRFLQKTVAEMAEKMIVGQVEANLASVARGVGQLLTKSC